MRSIDSIRKDFANAVRKSQNKFDGEIKISAYDITTGTSLHTKGYDSGWAASIIKVPVLVAVSEHIRQGKLALEDKLEVNHAFILEDYDTVSQLPHGCPVSVHYLLDKMIVNSDNTATNMLVDKIGIHTLNIYMWELGMNRSMLGHLLCPKVPRYTSPFNLDGSNITCPIDMARLFRHIYQRGFSKLEEETRVLSEYIMKRTKSHSFGPYPLRKSTAKTKAGFITDKEDGADQHYVGIIDDHLIVSFMLNKIGQKTLRSRASASSSEYVIEEDSPILHTQTSKVYRNIMGVLEEAFL